MARTIPLLLLVSALAACWGTPLANPATSTPSIPSATPSPLEPSTAPSPTSSEDAGAMEPCPYLFWAAEKAGNAQDALDAGEVDAAAEIMREIEQRPAPEQASIYRDLTLQWLAVMAKRAAVTPGVPLPTITLDHAKIFINLELQTREILGLCPNYFDTPTSQP